VLSQRSSKSSLVRSFSRPSQVSASGHGRSVTLPSIQSTYAAAALCLTPLQARAFIAAQVAVPALKGVAPLRTLLDVVQYVALHNPQSRFRVAQRASHRSHASGTSKLTIASGPTSEDPRWTELVSQWQRLLDEHIHAHLAAVSEHVRWITRKRRGLRAFSCTGSTPTCNHPA
jgi:hypothetical protein